MTRLRAWWIEFGYTATVFYHRRLLRLSPNRWIDGLGAPCHPTPRRLAFAWAPVRVFVMHNHPFGLHSRWLWFVPYWAGAK